MKFPHTLVLLLLVISIAPSCAAVVGSPVTGFLVTNVAIPGRSFETADDLQVDLSNLVRGEASVTSFLGLFAGGDASIKKAAANGGIRKIHHVDYEVFSVLGIFAKSTTVVYGQQ